MVRSHLEYANAVWNPHKGLIKDIERVYKWWQLKWYLDWEKNATGRDLTELKLPTLKYRRIRGDMIEVFNILTDNYNANTVLYTWI